MKRKLFKTLSTLAVVIIAALSCTTAFALPSPTGAPVETTTQAATTGTSQTNTSKTSPQTGTSPILPIAVAGIAVAGVGAVVVKRKIAAK